MLAQVEQRHTRNCSSRKARTFERTPARSTSLPGRLPHTTQIPSPNGSVIAFAQPPAANPERKEGGQKQLCGAAEGGTELASPCGIARARLRRLNGAAAAGGELFLPPI